VEGLLSVDLKLTSWAVVIISELVFGILDATSSTVAIVVKTVSIRSVA
jgi:hypothetical protein